MYQVEDNETEREREKERETERDRRKKEGRKEGKKDGRKEGRKEGYRVRDALGMPFFKNMNAGFPLYVPVLSQQVAH